MLSRRLTEFRQTEMKNCRFQDRRKRLPSIYCRWESLYIHLNVSTHLLGNIRGNRFPSKAGLRLRYAQDVSNRAGYDGSCCTHHLYFHLHSQKFHLRAHKRHILQFHMPLRYALRYLPHGTPPRHFEEEHLRSPPLKIKFPL